MDNWNKPWLRSTFSESDGTGSMSRLCVFLVIAASVAILGYLAWKRPDTFTAAITLLMAFDVSVVGVIYGINKASQTVQLGIEAKKDGAQ